MALIRHINEKYLVTQVAEGNKKAFEEIYYAYHSQIGSFVAAWTKSVLVAEDVVQDIFLKIWLNREALKEVERFDNYLYIVSRNLTYNALRQTAKKRLKNQEWAKHFENEQEITPDNTNTNYISLVEAAVARLAPQQKKVYTLKRHDGLKYEEIGHVLGIAPQTARKHLEAAVRNITTYVKKRLHIILLLWLLN